MRLIRKRQIVIAFAMSLSLLFGYVPTDAIAISQLDLDMLYEDYHGEDLFSCKKRTLSDCNCNDKNLYCN